MGFHRSSKMGFAAIGGNLGPFTLRVSQTCNPSLHITSLSSHLCFSTHPPQEKHKKLSYFNIHPSFPRKKKSNFNIHPIFQISLRKVSLQFPPKNPKNIDPHPSILPSSHPWRPPAVEPTLRGLPLSWQLLERGGRFVRKATTAPRCLRVENACGGMSLGCWGDLSQHI